MKSAVVSEQEPKWAYIRPAKGWVLLDLREIWSFRDLLFILMMRDVKLRYKQTLLGIVWVILQPLVSSMIFAVIFGLFASLPSDDSPYLLFVYAGILPWNMFAGALQRAGNSLVGDSRLISKVYFPRILIPMASAFAVIVDFFVALAVMLVFLVIFELPLTLNILVLPVLLIVTLVISVGLSTMFSALNVYYRDFSYALPFLVQLWMYASPVVYSTNLIPERFKLLYALNPMVGVIEGFRWALLDTISFPWGTLGSSVVIGVIILSFSVAVFQRVERNFADVV